MILDNPNKKLEIILGSAKTTTDMPVCCSYEEKPITGITGSVDTQTNGVTAVPILTGGQMNTTRWVKDISVLNVDTVAKVVTVRLNNAGTLRPIYTCTLQVGDMLGYADYRGWYVKDANGNEKTSATQYATLDPSVFWTTLRNAFINGDDSVNQVNNPSNGATGTAVTVTAGAAVASVIDRWYAACTGQNISAQQVAGTGQFKYAMKLIAGATGPTTTLFGTRLEGKDCYKYINQPMNIRVDTFGDVARTVTWTAYYANALDNFSTKTQIATGTINATNANATYNVQFNAGANAGNGICVEFTTGALTNSTGFQTYQGRQLEQVASGATSGTAFEFLKYPVMLALCQRYLPCWNSSGTIDFRGSAATFNTTGIIANLPLQVQTRIPVTGIAGASITTPSQISHTFNANAVSAVSIGGSSITNLRLIITSSGLTAFQAADWYFNNAAGQIYGTGAELW